MKFCFHKYGQWSRLVSGYNGEKTQFRECRKCGKAEFRSLGYCQGTTVHEANEALMHVALAEEAAQ